MKKISRRNFNIKLAIGLGVRLSSPFKCAARYARS